MPVHQGDGVVEVQRQSRHQKKKKRKKRLLLDGASDKAFEELKRSYRLC